VHCSAAVTSDSSGTVELCRWLLSTSQPVTTTFAHEVHCVTKYKRCPRIVVIDTNEYDKIESPDAHTRTGARAVTDRPA
jgi:hypothetical protein